MVLSKEIKERALARVREMEASDAAVELRGKGEARSMMLHEHSFPYVIALITELYERVTVLEAQATEAAGVVGLSRVKDR